MAASASRLYRHIHSGMSSSLTPVYNKDVITPPTVCDVTGSNVIYSTVVSVG